MSQTEKNFLSEFQDLESDVSDHENILNKDLPPKKEKILKEIENEDKNDKDQLYLF